MNAESGGLGLSYRRLSKASTLSDDTACWEGDLRSMVGVESAFEMYGCGVGLDG